VTVGGDAVGVTGGVTGATTEPVMFQPIASISVRSLAVTGSSTPGFA
jgi:hypothetical protein